MRIIANGLSQTLGWIIRLRCTMCKALVEANTNECEYGYNPPEGRGNYWIKCPKCNFKMWQIK